MDEYKIKHIEEGLTQIEFPEFDKISSDAPVFYNPHMEMNRDLSILAIQVFQKQEDREINICDLFGGSGIRGVRYKNEIDGVGEVSINDISETANHFERHNIELNNLDDVEVYQHDASMFLRMKRGEFDVIDIDPFGTPSPFMDSAGYGPAETHFYALQQLTLQLYAEPIRSHAFANIIQNLIKANTAMKPESEFWPVLLRSHFRNIQSTLK